MLGLRLAVILYVSVYSMFQLHFLNAVQAVIKNSTALWNVIIAFIALLYRYSREAPFIALNVDIRNHHNLLDSMEQFVKGDLLEGANAYHCEKCDKKVLYCSTVGDHLLRLDLNYAFYKLK